MDQCAHCHKPITFDEDAEVYRLDDDPDAIFCEANTDPDAFAAHEPD